MSLSPFGRGAAALGVCLLLFVSESRALWTITTYKAPPEMTPVEITSTSDADAFFDRVGGPPPLIDAMGTVTMIDLFENGGAGQFPINNLFPGFAAGEDHNDFVARITGTLVVNVAGRYDFFTDSDDGNRFRLDVNQNGMFEDFGGPPDFIEESIVPDGGLQGAGTPERSLPLMLAAGEYAFNIQMFERGGGASIDAGYRQRPLGMPAGTQRVLGDAAGGIALKDGIANVHVKVADPSTGGTGLLSFIDADLLRTGPNAAGFPVSEAREVFNIYDTDTDGLTWTAANGYPGQGAPGLGAPGISDDNDFMVVGTGMLVVPPGGITNAIFRSTTDDGGRLLIDVNQNGSLFDFEDTIILADVLQDDTNINDSFPISLAAGQYLIEYSFFERGGGASGEVGVSLDGGTTWRLLGDDAAVMAGTSLDVIGGVVPAVNGDFNNDGVVDTRDYVVWRNGDPLQNEGGVTLGANTPEDYQTWRANYGRTPAGAAIAAGVPEAATLVSAAIALLLGCVCRRPGRS